MRQCLAVILLVCFCITGMVWCDPALSQTYNLKLGTPTAIDHAYNVGARKFAEMVAERTANRVKIDVYPANQLGNERDMVEGLQLGTVDLVVSSTGPLGGFVPKMLVVDLPFLFRDKQHAYSVLDGPIGKELLDEFIPKGIKGLAFWENGFRHITNNVRPIEKPQDLKGIKIRTMENKIHLSAFRAFGASPAPMAWGEVYTALQQKTIDAQENPIAVIYTSKINEVQKYLALTGHFYSPAALLMSRKVFDSLPEDIQRVMVAAAVECANFERNYLNDTEEKQLEELKAKGMQVTVPDKKLFQEAIAPVYNEFESQFGRGMIERIVTFQ
ncbi:MAG: TRAP transporter substrate-binding protein [Syntrophobacteraceae bacterium]